MKKKILGLALIAMSMVAFQGMAQNNNPAAAGAQVENVKGQKAEKKQKRAVKNPYEGLTLTEAQKQQLADLDAQRKAAKQQKKEVAKAEKKQKSEADRAARKAAKQDYLQQVKAIIGPDQYVIFLENMYMNAGGQKGANKGGKHAGMKQRGGKHNFSQKGEKGAKDNARTQKGNRKGGPRAQQIPAHKNA